MAAVVVGGAYRETCSEPPVDWVYGSGVRAAVVLGADAERLVTVADSQTLQQIHGVLGGVPVEATPRQSCIAFDYDTPLSPPRMFRDSSDHNIEVPNVEAIDAVVFGMVESQPTVQTERAVVDPQHSMDISQINGLITADELVIVANRREVLTLVGDQDLDRAVQTIFAETGAMGVVVKAGALGALVFQQGRAFEGVAAVATPCVFPIGSGDVFSAALAQRYFENGDLRAAAHSASWRTAGYVTTRQLGPVSLDSTSALTCVPTLSSVQHPPMVYVAASFENPEQRWSAGTIAKGIQDIGARSIYPLRDIGLKTTAEQIAREDLAALNDCDAVVLLADVARTGPFFEAGWATSLGLPIVLMNSDTNPDRYTMLIGSGARSVSDLTTAAYCSVWAAIEHRQGTASTDTLLLLSGGLDSAAVAKIERPTRAVFIDYGQEPAEAERIAARSVAAHLSLELDELTVDLSAVGTGLLAGTAQVEDAPSPEWFPYRNQHLVTIAAGHAVKHGLSAVLLGIVAGDGCRHADSTAEFVTKLDVLTRSQEGGIRVFAPQVTTSPHELLLASKLPEDLIQQTHSCHTSNVMCGDCPGCRSRHRTLSEALLMS